MEESLLWSIIGVLSGMDRCLLMSPKEKLLNTPGGIQISDLKLYYTAIVSRYLSDTKTEMETFETKYRISEINPHF